jgi:hypothetical protein
MPSRRRRSISRNQLTVWFQLVTVWATNSFLLSPDFSCTSSELLEVCLNRSITSCGTVEAQRGHNLGHSSWLTGGRKTGQLWRMGTDSQETPRQLPGNYHEMSVMFLPFPTCPTNPSAGLPPVQPSQERSRSCHIQGYSRLSWPSTPRASTWLTHSRWAWTGFNGTSSRWSARLRPGGD